MARLSIATHTTMTPSASGKKESRKKPGRPWEREHRTPSASLRQPYDVVVVSRGAPHDILRVLDDSVLCRVHRSANV